MNVDGKPASKKMGTASVRGWQYLRSSVMSGNSRPLRESLPLCHVVDLDTTVSFGSERREAEGNEMAQVEKHLRVCTDIKAGLNQPGEQGRTDPITCNITDTVDSHVRRQAVTIIGSRCDLVPQSSLHPGNL